MNTRSLFIFATCAIISVSLLSSCNREKETTDASESRSMPVVGFDELVDGSAREYTSFNILLDDCDYIYEVEQIKNEIYLVVESDNYIEDSKGQKDINFEYSVQASDMQGNVSLISKIDIDEAFGFCFVDSDIVASVNNNGIDLIDIKTGKIIKEITDAGLVSDSDIYSRDCVLDRCKDGFVASYTHKCVKYDISGEEIGRIESEEFNHSGASHAYLEFGDKEYAVSYSGMKVVFYELDFENKSYMKTREASLNMGDGAAYISGTGNYLYQYGSNDVLCLSPTEEESVICAKDSNMLLTGVIGDEGDYRFDVLGNNMFVNIYNSTPIPQIRVIYESSDLNLSSRQIVRASVASSDMTDPGLKSAVAEYNMSQSDYLIVLESEVFYDETGKDIQAEVMSSLINGDIPDLVIGSQFNPIYLANAGLLEDLSDYIASSDSIDENIKRLMLSGDGCYYLFAGYCQDGYVGKGENFTGIDPEIGSLPFTDNLYGSQPAIMIVDPVIRNEVAMAGLSDQHIDQTRIETILSYALKSGGSYSTSMPTMLDNVYSDTCRLARFDFGDFGSFRYMYSKLGGDIFYAGYPSVDEQLRPATSVCQVSIMADSEYKDAIYDFLDILLSYDNQRQILCSQQGYIPVNAQVMEDYFDCLTDPQIIKDPIGEYWYENATIYEKSSITASEIEQYKMLKCSPNCILASVDQRLWNIIFEEIESYYLSDKSVNEIATSLTSRLNLYLDENYS